MKPSNAEQIAEYVRSLSNFVFYKTIDGNYNHIGATIADAVLQANMKYATHVKPRINRILAIYPELRTTSAVNGLLKRIGTKEFLNWNGEDRADRFNRVLTLFSDENIETEADLRSWLSDDTNLLKLRSINGIGPKTVDYFKILVGISTNAIDRHLLNFLKMAGLSHRSYNEAQALINDAADILSIDRAQFDHSIWQYMSKMASKALPQSVHSVPVVVCLKKC